MHSAVSYLQQFSFFFAFLNPVSVVFLFSAVTLNSHSRDFVVPWLLNLHPFLRKPEAGSAELREVVQRVGAAGWHVMVHVEVLAHAI